MRDAHVDLKIPPEVFDEVSAAVSGRAGQAIAVVGVAVAGTRVAVLWIVLNPVKLGGWHRR